MEGHLAAPSPGGPLRRELIVGGIGVLILLGGAPSAGQPVPAGGTAAVLSFIDAAGGGVEVVRHWPGAPSDVAIAPFVPYFWSGCPGPGAIMMLVTAPGSGPPLSDRIARALSGRFPDPNASRESVELARIAAALRTPGSPVQEALKAAAPWISDLATYERLGYAVFLFVRWQGIFCAVVVQAVPEGYGIPFVD